MASVPPPALKQYATHGQHAPYQIQIKHNLTFRRLPMSDKCLLPRSLSVRHAQAAKEQTQKPKETLTSKADLIKLHDLLAITRGNGFETRFQWNPKRNPPASMDRSENSYLKLVAFANGLSLH